MKNIINELKNDFKETLVVFKDKPYKHLPNIISALRIAAIPVIGAVALSGNMPLAFYLSVGAFVSDKLDGTLANLFDAKSNLGRRLDPLADKLLFGVISLLVLPNSPYVISMMALEGLITKVNLDIHKLDTTTKSSEMGRKKAVALDTTILAVMASSFIPALTAPALLLTGVTLTMQAATYLGYKNCYEKIIIKQEYFKHFHKIDNSTENFSSKKRDKHLDLVNKVECKMYGKDYEPVKEHEKCEVINLTNKKRTCRSLIDDTYKVDKPNIKRLIKDNKTK